MEFGAIGKTLFAIAIFMFIWVIVKNVYSSKIFQYSKNRWIAFIVGKNVCFSWLGIVSARLIKYFTSFYNGTESKIEIVYMFAIAFGFIALTAIFYNLLEKRFNSMCNKAIKYWSENIKTDNIKKVKYYESDQYRNMIICICSFIAGMLL